MFGYIVPRKDKLSESASEQYKAAYCGLCRSLKKRYGFHARFLVNYDMVFLYFLLQKQRLSSKRCFCPARIVCRKNCLPNDEVMGYAADMSVLLSYWKLTDAVQDGSGFKRFGYKTIRLLYRRAYKKAARLHTDADVIFSEQLSKLQALEKQKCASIDRAADAFARMLHGCAAYITEEKQRRTAEILLYHVGRFLYLVDALEDLPKDRMRESYNPLRYRYELQESGLAEDDLRGFMQSVDASIDMAASALELLQPSENDELLKNIIYYGMPAVLKCVADGTFRKRGKHDEGSL